jgi:hypothetical protein
MKIELKKKTMELKRQKMQNKKIEQQLKNDFVAQNIEQFSQYIQSK